MKKQLMFWLRLLLSVGLIAFLVYNIDLQNMAALVAGSNAWYLLLAFVIAMGDRVMMAYKWNVLLKAKGMQIPLLKLTGTYLVSTFLGLFLPATVGADALRAYAVAKEGRKTSDVVSSILVERVLGVVALLICVLIAIVLSVFVFGQNFFGGIWSLFWIIAGSLMLLAAALLVSVNRRVTAALAGWLGRRKLGGGKLVAKLKEVYSSYMSYRDAQPALALFLLLSFVENLFPITMNYYISRAFHIEVSPLYFFILTPIVLVLVRLPISLDGIGIHQGTFVYFLALIGVGGSQALLLSVASHIMALLSVVPGGVLYSTSGLNLRLQPPPAAAQNVERRT